MEVVKKYIVVTDDVYHYASGYYTMNKWTKTGDLILARYIDKEMEYKVDPSELVYYSVSNECVTEVFCNDANGTNYVVCGDMIYYCTNKSVKSINIETKETKTIYEFTDVRFLMPHITNDGKYLNLEGHREDGMGEFLVIDVETNEAEIAFTKDFLTPFQTANHGMICPQNPDIMFFSHEGDTQYITNRLWAYDRKNDKMWNVVKQEMTENGDLGEYFGHEMWAPDGKGLYFVKYPQSPIKPTGLCYTDLSSGTKEILFSGYPYWHVGVSKDGKYLLADTMRGVFDGTDLCDVVLADIQNKTETVVDVVHSTGKHPCHPHPSMSPDSKRIVYNAFENGKIIARIATLY